MIDSRILNRLRYLMVALEILINLKSMTQTLKTDSVEEEQHAALWVWFAAY
jgi:hypothetical protein